MRKTKTRPPEIRAPVAPPAEAPPTDPEEASADPVPDDPRVPRDFCPSCNRRRRIRGAVAITKCYACGTTLVPMRRPQTKPLRDTGLFRR